MTAQFTILTQDRVSGREVFTRSGDRVTVHYEFADRGRGPNYDVSYQLDEHGLITAWDARGVDYLRKPFEERFRVEGGRATWQSPSDTGSAEATGPAMYYPVETPINFEALLLRAVSPGKDSVKLYPEGEARVSVVKTREVTANQQTRTVRLVEIYGLWMGPAYVWIDADGQPFATVSTWVSGIREGWETLVPSLIADQEHRETERWREIAGRLLKQPPAAGVAFTHARVFDPATRRVSADVTIVVRQHRILRVGPSARVAVPAGAEVHDLGGRMVLPGLWDMHVHTFEETALLELASGVTTIRDLGNDVDQTVRLRKQFDSGEILGPRMLVAGFVDGKGPFTGPTGVIVDDEAQARAAVERFAANGFVQVKIYGSIKPELVPVLVRAAKAHGMRVSGR